MDSPSASEPDQAQAVPTAETLRSGSGKSLVIALLVAAAAALTLFALFSGGESASEAPSEVSDLTFLTTSGETSSLSAYEGDLLVVNFFASWCAPCRAELPEFEEVANNNLDTVRFVGVNHDLDEQTWRTFVSETEISFETVFQPNTEIWTALDAKGMPSTAFVTADGEVVHLWTGVLSAELLQEKIDEHLLENA